MNYLSRLREQTSGLVRQRMQFTRSESSSGLDPDFIRAKTAMRELRKGLDALEAAVSLQHRSGEAHDRSSEQLPVQHENLRRHAAGADAEYS